MYIGENFMVNEKKDFCGKKKISCVSAYVGFHLAQ